MNNRKIQLTENKLRNIIRESVRQALKEGIDDDYDEYMDSEKSRYDYMHNRLESHRNIRDYNRYWDKRKLGIGKRNMNNWIHHKPTTFPIPDNE